MPTGRLYRSHSKAQQQPARSACSRCVSCQRLCPQACCFSKISSQGPWMPFKDSHLWRRDIEITQDFTQFTPFLSFLASFWTKEALRTHQTPTLQLENKQNRVKAYKIMVEQMLKSANIDENHCKTVNANEKHEKKPQNCR